MNGRMPRNPAERVCVEKLAAMGYTIHRHGWPDLLAERDGEFILVQIAAKRSRRRKLLQTRVMQTFAAKRMKAYRWEAEAGFVPIVAPTDRV